MAVPDCKQRFRMEAHGSISAPFEQSAHRKNSDLIREAQSTFSGLPQKDAEDLREFLAKNSDNIRTYDLNPENLKLLKHLRKCPSLSCPDQNSCLTAVGEETNDLHKRETTALFVSNIVLTTRLKKLLDENRELKRALQPLEVALQD